MIARLGNVPAGKQRNKKSLKQRILPLFLALLLGGGAHSANAQTNISWTDGYIGTSGYAGDVVNGNLLSEGGTFVSAYYFGQPHGPTTLNGVLSPSIIGKASTSPASLGHSAAARASLPCSTKICTTWGTPILAAGVSC